MSTESEDQMEKRVSRAVNRAFKRLIRNIENEPGLILEGADQPEENQQALTEVRSWLFSRRHENGDTSN